jgi:hypothetical protein
MLLIIRFRSDFYLGLTLAITTPIVLLLGCRFFVVDEDFALSTSSTTSLLSTSAKGNPKLSSNFCLRISAWFGIVDIFVFVSEALFISYQALELFYFLYFSAILGCICCLVMFPGKT